MKSLALALLLAVCLALAPWPSNRVDASRIEDVSFKPPFEKVDADGRRIVNDTWVYGGSAEAKKHFVRLTTDRQSKKGYLWQKEKVGRDTFSAVLTFRISGVGKRWFGDGIGLWLTSNARYAPGVNHGFTDKYTGVGIVIDTFNNPEHKGGHKDVSVFINDGSKNYEQLYAEKRLGCDAAVRYHEESASFDPVHSMSRVKVKVDKTRLVVEVDAGASGQWVACHEVTLPFAANWLKDATIGISAATGALADNHDIIRFDAFTDFTDEDVGLVDSEAIMHTVSKDYKKWLDSPSCGTDCIIAVMQKELGNFRVDAEHRFADLKEKTENTVGKMKKQDMENERRIAELEAKVAKKIDAKLDETNANLGTEVNVKIAKQLADNPDIGGGGWKTPFFLLFLGLSAGAAFVYRKYQALMKSHLL